MQVNAQVGAAIQNQYRLDRNISDEVAAQDLTGTNGGFSTGVVNLSVYLKNQSLSKTAFTNQENWRSMSWWQFFNNSDRKGGVSLGDGVGTELMSMEKKATNVIDIAHWDACDGGAATWTLNSVTAISTGAWHFFVIRMNDTSSVADFWIDGVLNATDSTIGCGSVLPPDTADDLYVGARWNNADKTVGMVDDLCSFSQVLSTTDISFMYDNQISCSDDAPDVAPSATISINNTAQDIWHTINISSSLTDTTGLSFAWFLDNFTGVNTTKVAKTGTSDEASTAQYIDSCGVYNFTVFVNDTTNQISQNSTTLQLNCSVRNASTVVSSGSGTAWANPDNARLCDNSYATATLLGSTSSAYLNFTNFNLSIPTDITIAGIKTRVERKEDLATSNINDSIVQLSKFYSLIGNSKATNNEWSTADENATYGGFYDTWGASWLRSGVHNTKGFGIVVSAYDAGLAGVASVDCAQIAVFYNGTDTSAPEVIKLNATCEGGLGQVIYDIENEIDNRQTAPFASTNDSTCTFFLITDEPATCAIIDNNRDLNWTDIYSGNANLDSGAPALTHTLTLNQSNQTIGYGLHNFSIGCKNSAGKEALNSSSGKFLMNITNPIAPQITLNKPSNNSLFLKGTNNTILFNFTSTDDDSSNYNCDLFIDNVLEYTNSTYNNGTNALFTKEVTTAGIRYWNVTCRDNYGNANYSETRQFTIIAAQNHTLYLDGLNDTRKYELGFELLSPRAFHQNITAISYDGTHTCLDLGDELCVIQGDNYTYLINTTYVNLTQFANATNISVIAPGGNATIALDNRSDVLSAFYKISGESSSGSYPLDVSVDEDGDGRVEKIFPGELQEDSVVIHKFKYGTNEYNSTNVTYAESLSAQFTFNASSSILLGGATTLQISGRALDLDNDFDFNEYFNGTQGSVSFNSTIISNSSAPIGVLDDFKSDVGNWMFPNTGGTTSVTISGGTMLMEQDSSLSFAYVRMTDQLRGDMRNSSKFVVENVTYSLSCTAGSNPGSSSSAAFSIVISDNSSYITLFTASSSCPSNPSTDSDSGSFNFSIESRDYANSQTWEWYQNGVSQGTTYLGSLDYTKPITLMFGFQTPKYNVATASADTTATRINMSGGTLFRNTTRGEYESNGNITSGRIQNTASNLARILFTATHYAPNGTNITYYVSNVCSTANPIFEQVTSGVLHTFTQSGSAICWRANLQSNNKNLSPVIRRITTDIISSTAENISIDWGSDGTIDSTFLGVLNETNSPFVFNVSNVPLNTYRNQSCLNLKVCSYPFSLSTTTRGVISLDELNATQDMDYMAFKNLSALENSNRFNMSMSLDRGRAYFTQLVVNYKGNKNITALIRGLNSTFYTSNPVNRTIQIIYSKVNRTSAPGTFVDVPIFQTKTANDSNITPFQQSDSFPIFNFTGQATEPFNLGIRINSSYSCVEFRAGNYSNVSLSANMTLEYRLLCPNVSTTGKCPEWMWASLFNCNASVRRSFIPQQKVQACCSECYPCF